MQHEDFVRLYDYDQHSRASGQMFRNYYGADELGDKSELITIYCSPEPVGHWPALTFTTMQLKRWD